MEVRILYCNVGESRYYDGDTNDKPIGGGSFNKNNIGFEINNFTNHNGTYYGYVEPVKRSILIERLSSDYKDKEKIDGVLVVWHCKGKIVGYYKNATVFRKVQQLPQNIAEMRVSGDYFITTKEAVLIPSKDREKIFDYKSQSNVWYGNKETNIEVMFNLLMRK